MVIEFFCFVLKLVPARVINACELSAGNCVYMWDCLGRTFRIQIKNRGMVYFLGSGWSDMLKQIDCGCGDELMLNFKASRTWKVLVFCGAAGVQKFPQRDERRVGCSAVESTNGEFSPNQIQCDMVYSFKKDKKSRFITFRTSWPILVIFQCFTPTSITAEGAHQALVNLEAIQEMLSAKASAILISLMWFRPLFCSCVWTWWFFFD